VYIYLYTLPKLLNKIALFIDKIQFLIVYFLNIIFYKVQMEQNRRRNLNHLKARESTIFVVVTLIHGIYDMLKPLRNRKMEREREGKQLDSTLSYILSK
jgi:hypothetical protein